MLLISFHFLGTTYKVLAQPTYNLGHHLYFSGPAILYFIFDIKQVTPECTFKQPQYDASTLQVQVQISATKYIKTCCKPGAKYVPVPFHHACLLGRVREMQCESETCLVEVDSRALEVRVVVVISIWHWPKSNRIFMFAKCHSREYINVICVYFPLNVIVFLIFFFR